MLPTPNASANLSFPIPMAKHIWFTYSNDEDDAVNCTEEVEEPEEE